MARKPKDDDETPEAPERPTPSPDERDRATMRGGPGDDAPAPAATSTPEPDQPPTRSRVKIGRQEFEVEPDMAAALEERERDYMRGIQMDRREREELDRFRRAAQPAPVSTEPDFNTLLFENPSKALALHAERIKRDLQQQYADARMRDRTWAKFYEDHADLVGEEFLVQARYEADYDSIAGLPVTKALEILADNVRKDLLRISRKTKGTGNPTALPTGRARVEDATGDRPPTSPRRTEADDDPNWSLSKEVRKRQATRRNAANAS